MGDRRRDRGVTPTLTYVLAIGIVTILVAALLVGTTTFVDDERSSVVREELQIVGDRLATDIGAVDRASRRGARVSQRTAVPDRVADAPYNLAVVDCAAGDACLELDSADPDIDVTVTVPLSNRSTVQIDRRSTQSVRIVADPSGGTAAGADADVSVNPNIGVAEDVEPGSGASGTTFNPTTAPVIQGFRFTPTPPATGETVTFDSDVVEVVDGNYTYEWDLDGDGTVDQSGNGTTASVASTSYGQPGRYPVTLTVTGPAGQSDSITQLVRVSGLILNETSQVAVSTDNDDDAAGIGFEVNNNFDSQQVRITDVTVRPEDPSVQYLRNGAGPEIAIRGAEGYEIIDDPARGDPGDPGDTDDSLNENGTIFQMTEPRTIDGGKSAGIQIGEFLDGSRDEYGTFGQRFNVSVRYDVGGDTNYVSRFPIEPGSSGAPSTSSPSVDEVEVEECGGPPGNSGSGNGPPPDAGPDHELEITVSDPDNNMNELIIEDTPDNGVIEVDIGPSDATYNVDIPSDWDDIEVTVTDDDGLSDTQSRTVCP